MKTAGIVGAVVGGAAAATAAAAFVVERRAAARRGRQGDTGPFVAQPSDRHGTVVAQDGAGLYYEEVGPPDAALTVVFVHGYTLDMRAFYFQRKALHEQFGERVRMIFYDQRCHGRSEHADPKHSTIDHLGHDLRAVIDTLVPTGPVVLVGHSMGGMTLLALADSHPELFEVPTGKRGTSRVAGVALISASAGGMAGVTLGLPALLARIKGPLLPLLLRGARRQADLVERGRAIGTDIAWVITRKMSFGSKEVPATTVEFLTTMIASTPIDVIADFYPALMSHDKLSALGVLSDVRVVIICGDRDVLTPLAHSKAIAEELPKAELIVVPQGGHAVLMEFPEVVDEALGRLVESALDDAGRRRKWWRP